MGTNPKTKNEHPTSAILLELSAVGKQDLAFGGQLSTKATTDGKSCWGKRFQRYLTPHQAVLDNGKNENIFRHSEQA